jgi:hypothetical protein
MELIACLLPRGGSAEVFQFSEHAFHYVAFLVEPEPPVAASLFLSVDLRRNDGLDATFPEPCQKYI